MRGTHILATQKSVDATVRDVTEMFLKRSRPCTGLIYPNPSPVPRPFYKTDPGGRVWENDLPFGEAKHYIPT